MIEHVFKGRQTPWQVFFNILKAAVCRHSPLVRSLKNLSIAWDNCQTRAVVGRDKSVEQPICGLPKMTGSEQRGRAFGNISMDTILEHSEVTDPDTPMYYSSPAGPATSTAFSSVPSPSSIPEDLEALEGRLKRYVLLSSPVQLAQFSSIDPLVPSYQRHHWAVGWNPMAFCLPLCPCLPFIARTKHTHCAWELTTCRALSLFRMDLGRYPFSIRVIAAPCTVLHTWRAQATERSFEN